MDKTQLWGETVIEHPSGVNASVGEIIQVNPHSAFFALMLIVVLLLIHTQIRRSLSSAVECCFRFLNTLKVEDNLSLEQGRVVLFVVSLFHFSVVSYHFSYLFHVELVDYLRWMFVPVLFLFLILLWLLRRALFAALGWVIRSPRELAFLAKGLRDYFILAAILTLPLSFFTLFSWPSAHIPMVIWGILALSGCWLLYLFRTLQYFLYVRFSVFFWFLYLCTLEVAPLALFFRILRTL
ncbi:MAG: DUF4271 domain-containing protein [Prevotellaceae bacterium]|jgi:hypothetical protein|nr:DUF4271 domain-containing protein [Prevotellaceae bacterium]